MRAGAQGLGLGYPDKPAIRPREYMYRYAEDLMLASRARSFRTRASPATPILPSPASWKNDDSELRATIGHGMPYVYATRTGNARALVGHRPRHVDGCRQGRRQRALAQARRALLRRVRADQEPLGKGRGRLRLGFGRQDYFSVAVLPDGDAATFNLFKAHAYAFVTDTKVSWSYDDATAELSTKFVATTTSKESGKGLEDSAILALYRHQVAQHDRQR